MFEKIWFSNSDIRKVAVMKKNTLQLHDYTSIVIVDLLWLKKILFAIINYFTIVRHAWKEKRMNFRDEVGTCDMGYMHLCLWNNFAKNFANIIRIPNSSWLQFRFLSIPLLTSLHELFISFWFFIIFIFRSVDLIEMRRKQNNPCLNN